MHVKLINKYFCIITVTYCVASVQCAYLGTALLTFPYSLSMGVSLIPLQLQSVLHRFMYQGYTWGKKTCGLTGWSIFPIKCNVQATWLVSVDGVDAVEWLVVVQWDTFSQQSAWQAASDRESITKTAGHTVSGKELFSLFTSQRHIKNDCNHAVKVKATGDSLPFILWSSRKAFIDFCHCNNVTTVTCCFIYYCRY